VVPQPQVEAAMNVIRKHPLGQDAAVIGEVVDGPVGKVYLKTGIGGI